MMTKTGMLVVTNPNKFIGIIPRIQSEIKKTLYIQFFPERHLRLPQRNSINVKQFFPPSFCSTVIQFYSNTVAFKHLDVRVLLGSLRDPSLTRITTKNPVEVIYFDQLLNHDEMQGFLKDCVQNKTSNCELVTLCDNVNCQDSEYSTPPKLNSEDKIYNNVVLGGTFDKLHTGHKILLTEAVLRCNRKVTVGVTDSKMLKSKKLWELIEPCEDRINNVKDFLEDVEPKLEYDVVSIEDMYGPTKDDPTFEMIIVSSETVKGGTEVNNLRLKNGLNPMAIHSVELLNEEKMDEIEEDKISSSNYRLRLLGTRIRTPEPRPNLPKLPYVIGLTGGIASGKSSISQRLMNLGAGVINCDRVAHELYAIGEPGHDIIVRNFGNGILTKGGEIDRKALGNIVFHDKEELHKLNKLLWPAILERTKEKISVLYKEGHQVVIIEAAILVLAGWHNHCHEVWTCIIPKAEAIKRLKDRDGLSEENAEARIASQLSNEKQLEVAHLVLCTLWNPEFTQKQVEKAWNETKMRLNIK